MEEGFIPISAELSWVLKFFSFIKKVDIEEGFVSMNLSKNKRWRAHPVFAKQQ